MITLKDQLEVINDHSLVRLMMEVQLILEVEKNEESKSFDNQNESKKEGTKKETAKKTTKKSTKKEVGEK